MKVSIKILDPTTIQILEGHDIVKKCLSYPSEIWIQTQFKKQRKEIIKDFVWGRKEKYTYTGFLPRIEKYCQKRGIEFVVTGNIKPLPYHEVNLPDFEIREIQNQAITEIHERQRGVINFATGIGKTKTVAALISTYNDPYVLFLCRSNDLVNQAYDVFTGFGFRCCKLGDGSKEISEKIVISTAQTYKNFDLVELSDRFQILVVDEAHIGFKPNSEYEKICQSCLAPIRIGLTATLSQKIENSLLLEGLIGEVLIKADTSYGVENMILSKPSIELLVIPESKSLKKYTTYKDIYNYGIVENNIRHNIICNAVENEIKSGNSVLIFCTEIEHIRNIGLVLKQRNIGFEVVHGEIGTEERTRIKDELNNKKNLVVISSAVWYQGLDIPNLNTIINASSGKSSEVVIQKAGRALRVTEEKKSAKIYDCLDQGKFISSHTIKRIIAYKNLGFM